MHAVKTFAELDDELATVDSTPRALAALTLALHTVQEVVQAWSGKPDRGGCLCRVADELGDAREIMARIVGPETDTVVPLPLGDPGAVPISGAARVLGRVARVLTLLARQGVADNPCVDWERLDPAARRACAAAWAIVFRNLVRLRAAEETATWSGGPHRHAPAIPPRRRRDSAHVVPFPARLA
ncbi:hypothetical protein [Embleya sp. NBC_00896]|uniref:hypothetical protein n=1 Tax=Embleya sp. NBC_00896 TaxID=2975961 RepID=UPI0038644769|nr:hypothetical protein OG928_08970 [Embleya sp. NBC_00896]